MNKRAYLRSSEGIFTLSPKITIIGREGCDFIIQNITVDSQQAVIEYFEGENCFVLKDLNSTNGTYVNECRIQNASIRLAECDVLKFGFSPGQYEFCSEDLSDGGVDMTTTYTQISTTQKPPWAQSPVYPTQQETSRAVTSLPIINYANPPPIQQRHTVSGYSSWTQLPRTPSSNPRLSRPISANGSNRRQLTPTAPHGSISGSSTFRNSVSGQIRQFLPDNRQHPTEVIGVAELQSEIERLRYFENQFNEISRQMENVVQQNKELLNSRDRSANDDVYGQIKELSDEVSRKCSEVERLQRLVEKMSGNTNRYGTNVSNNESDTGMLRQEVEKTRKDLHVSNGLVTSLQKDLSNRDDAIKKLNKDLEQLNHKISEKDLSISGLMNKLTRLQDVQEHMEREEAEKQEKEREMISIKHKLLTMETHSQENEEQLTSLTNLIEQLKQFEKANADIVQDLRLQIDGSKSSMEDLQRSESLLRVDAKLFENKYEKFRSEVIGVVLSIPEVKTDNGSLKDDDMIELMIKLVESKVDNDRRICEKDELYEVEKQAQRQLMESLEQLTAQLRECSSNHNSDERTSIKVSRVIDMLKSMTLNEYLQPLKELLVENFGSILEFIGSVESVVSEKWPEAATFSLSECFRRIMDWAIDAVEKKSQTDILLAEAHESKVEEIRKLNIDHQEELSSKIAEVINNYNSRNEEELRIAVHEAIELEQQKLEHMSKEFEDKIKEYEQTVDNLRKIDDQYSEQCRDNSQALSDKCAQLEDLQRQLSEVTESKNLLAQTMHDNFDASIVKWKSEIEAYKEETTQHSITIHTLNDQLMKLDKENKELHNQLTKKKKKDVRSIKNNEEHNEVAIIDTNHFNSTIANLERCVLALRQENDLLKNINHECEDTIKGLNLDLTGAEAQLSDLKGELNESQKNEISRLNLENQTLEEECKNVRVKLSNMSEIIDKLTQDLEGKKMENTNLTQQLSEEKSKVHEKDSKLQNMETHFASEQESWIHNLNRFEQEGRISTELATIGSQCRGDRHIQIIESQKMALTELRHKMKGIDIARLPSTNALEINQQMIQLKKELAELRATQALREGAPRGVDSLTDLVHRRITSRKTLKGVDDSNKSVTSENGTLLRSENESVEDNRAYKQMKFDLDLSKAAHTDLQQSFDLSETSYFNLLRQVLEVLDLEKMRGTRTFDNLPSEAKEGLIIERDENCQIILQKICILKEMIQRKDELLLSYERDLVKLKQAEDLTAKTKAQLEHIIQQTRTKGEEVDLLRETLNRTKDLLNQEKRVNNAIKQKKHYVPDINAGKSTPTPDGPKYHCPPEDIMGKDKQKEKIKTEKLKRKDYEIKSLKSELYSKDKELSQATNRLCNLETTMGIHSEEPVA